MKVLLIFSVALLAGVVQATDSSTRVVCYFANWAYAYSGLGQFAISDIDPQLCTHYIYSFVTISAEGEILITDQSYDIDQGGFANFTALKDQNSDLNLLVAIGGYNAGSTNFSIVAANETLRATFASNAVAFLEEYGFNGLDLDWEYPAQGDGSTTDDKENFVLFVQELKDAFESEGYLLSAAVSATQSGIDTSYNVTGLNELLDFFNVMAYDLHGTWDGVTGANAPLYPQVTDVADTVLTVDASINAWLSSGASASKLNVGLGLYGHAYTLADASVNGTGANITDAAYSSPYTGETSTWYYIEICSDIKNNSAEWTITNDRNRYVYGVRDTLWIGYDNVDTLYAKGAYAKEMGLGGLMTWTVVGDDFRGYCGPKYALTKAAIRGYEEASTTSSD